MPLSKDPSAKKSQPLDATSPSPTREKPIVAQIKNPKAILWDGESDPYVDFLDQDAVKDMLQVGIREITKEKDLVSAWEKLIPYKVVEI